MIFISDVHHGLDSLENLPSGKGPLVILGDLINWIDYRNGDGIAKDVFGEESVAKLVELRKKHDFTRRKELWNELFQKDRELKQKKIEESIYRQYSEVFDKVKNFEVFLIPGNVDSLKILEETKTNNVTNIDGEILDYKGFKIGFAGGGVPTPINARGEIPEEEFKSKLENLGDIDIICSHAPPYVDELITDVITNKKEQGWKSLKKFIQDKEPKFSIFGDVHQPKAYEWKIGLTKCINVGYFRSSSNYLDIETLSI